MAYTESKNKVLVVGSAQVGKKHLVRQIIAHNAQNTNRSSSGEHQHHFSTISIDSNPQAQDTSGAQGNRNIDFAVCKNRLVTKYYSADLDFYVLKLWEKDFDVFMQNVLFLSSINREDGNENFWLGFQALILVFDVHNTASFAAIKDFHKTLDALNASSFEISLCVGNDARGMEKTKEQLREAEKQEKEIMEWCFDNGFEYVKLTNPNNKNEPLPEEAEQNEEDDEDTYSNKFEKQGAARVLEALECNMWSDLIQDNSNSSSIIGGGVGANTAGSKTIRSNLESSLRTLEKQMMQQAEEEEEERKQQQQQEEEEQEQSPATASAAAVEQPSADEPKLTVTTTTTITATESTSEAATTSTTTTTAPSSSSSAATTAAASGTATANPFLSQEDEAALWESEEATGEKSIDDFDRLFTQIMQMRKQAASLSDADRRERAARLATSLWKMLGTDSDDDDEGTHSDSD